MFKIPGSRFGAHIARAAAVTWATLTGNPLTSIAGLVTTVGSPGSDTNLATEKAIRSAISAAGGGDFSGPGSATDSDFVQFDGTTGKLGKDGGLSLTTSLGSPGSDAKIPSEKAVRSALSAAPGTELDYVQVTSNTNITGTTEGGATNVITGSGVAYDGSTVVLLEFYAYSVLTPTAGAGSAITIVLYDDTGSGAASIGVLGQFSAATTQQQSVTMRCARRLTPSNATHTYSIRAFVSSTTGTPSVRAGAGGNGSQMPAFLRITRVA